MQTQNKLPKLKKINYQVPFDYDGYRLDKLIRKLQPQWSKVYVLKLIRKKDILVNNKTTTANYHLKINDIVNYFGLENIIESNHLQFDLKQLEKLPALEVIYEDTNIIIVNKPIKIPVQSTVSKNYDNMNNRLLKHLKFDLSQNSFKPVFVHRLDQNTTGLLIGAKTYKAYQRLIDAFRKKMITKIYHALVWNPFHTNEMEIKNYLVKDEKTNISYVTNSHQKNAKFAHTTVYHIKNFRLQSYLKLILHTGRAHQIRVHLNHIGHPVCGDRKYGFYSQNKIFPSQALIASELIFDDQICVKELNELKKVKLKIDYFWFLKNKYILD